MGSRALDRHFKLRSKKKLNAEYGGSPPSLLWPWLFSFLYKTFVRSVALLQLSKIDLGPDLRSLTKPVCARDTPPSTFMIAQLNYYLDFPAEKVACTFMSVMTDVSVSYNVEINSQQEFPGCSATTFLTKLLSLDSAFNLNPNFIAPYRFSAE